MLFKDKEERRKLIARMNGEMKAITNSPSIEVRKFRIGLLAKLAGELKIINDRIRRKSYQFGRVS
ncbi:hypothetical protein QT711_03525 [Sporosarcina saromensis]|uniref:50S ribosomal protein L29 n=1 Tax=Sporosarcina saromensis TaxID=359365 RepID=A0ABU4G5R1_9BACL|nr:hypothetical protein [Sporosarcina saromensis]MDW0112241.1 hypothetical protein [Sporosarcina saromensis]